MVLALCAALAMPALAHDDEQWDDRDTQDWDGRDDGSLRQQHHHHRREHVIVPNGGRAGATQPYWGTTQPYWGTMRPYWGSNTAPLQQPNSLAPLNRRSR